MIQIVGTSHISKESIDRINVHIDTADIVALELDSNRLQALLSKQKTSKNPVLIGKIGLLGYLFLVIASGLQQKLGKITGLTPGSELLHAYKTAAKKNLQVALIDQDVRITLNKLSRMKLKHKLSLLKEMFKPAPKNLRFDIRTIPDEEVITTAMNYLKKVSPPMHKILVDERNHVMAQKLAILQHKFPDKKILAVIGAGHAKEVATLATKYINQINQKALDAS